MRINRLSAAFWRGAVERAVATGAQAAVALLTVDTTGLLQTGWRGLGSAAVVAAVLSLLKSLGLGAVVGRAGLRAAEVPADRVVAMETGSGLVVAAEASALPNGTPVLVEVNPAYS